MILQVVRWWFRFFHFFFHVHPRLLRKWASVTSIFFKWVETTNWKKITTLFWAVFCSRKCFFPIQSLYYLLPNKKPNSKKNTKKRSRWLFFFLHFVDPTGESLKFAQSFHLGSVFKLHDFGFRGVSSVESAAIGGATWQHSFFWESEWVTKKSETDFV